MKLSSCEILIQSGPRGQRVAGTEYGVGILLNRMRRDRYDRRAAVHSMQTAIVLTCLKVALELAGGDTSVAIARVLFVNRSQLLAGVCLLVQDGTCDRHNFFFAVHGVLEKSRTPSVASDNSASNKNGGSSELTRQIVQKGVCLKCSIKDVA
jgi:hypothetical protein